MPKHTKKRSDQAQVFHFALRFTLSVASNEIDLEAAVRSFATTTRDALSAALKEEMGAKGRYIFQLECTPRSDEESKLDNWHFQCYLQRSFKERPRTLGARLGKTFPGIYVSASSTAGIEATRTYSMKRDDSYRAGPWADRPIMAVYAGQDLPRTWRPWQAQVINEVANTEPDDRTINWVFDPDGKTGKSKVAKYITWKKLGKFMSFESAANLLYQVLAAGAQRAYFFDLPRTKGKGSHMEDIYQALESIKNGLVQSGKYEGGELLMNPPHVWVFSNFPPDREKMSKDRFKIWHVNRENWTMYIAPAFGQV